jgi:Ca2+-binding EF-hand superfamily protein
MGHHDMAGHGMHGQGGMAAAHMKMQATMDADHDGRVSASEHAAAARSMFAKADADHDGYVTKAEFSARKEAMRQP